TSSGCAITGSSPAESAVGCCSVKAVSGSSANGWLSSSGSAGGGSAAGVCGFLRNQPNKPFFSPAAAGAFLSSLEPNIEKIFSRGRYAGGHATGQTEAILAL